MAKRRSKKVTKRSYMDFGEEARRRRRAGMEPAKRLEVGGDGTTYYMRAYSDDESRAKKVSRSSIVGVSGVLNSAVQRYEQAQDDVSAALEGLTDWQEGLALWAWSKEGSGSERIDMTVFLDSLPLQGSLDNMAYTKHIDAGTESLKSLYKAALWAETVERPDLAPARKRRRRRR